MFPVLRVRGERKENRTARAGEETGWENTVVCTRMRARTHTQQVLPRGGSEQAHASAGDTRFCRGHTLLQGAHASAGARAELLWLCGTCSGHK